MKTEAMCFLRFVRHMEYVGSEVGHWKADVLGISPTHSVEIEVKTSLADLNRDFLRKDTKHYFYASGASSRRHVPNYLYFMVPRDLVEKATVVLEAKCPKAGLLAYDSSLLARPGEKTLVIKRASKLHAEEPSAATIRTALLRMGSELCTKNLALDMLSEKVNEIQSMVIRKVDEALEAREKTNDQDG